MEQGKLRSIGKTLQKFKYPAIILLLGVFLLLWPAHPKQTSAELPAESAPPTAENPELAAQMEEILSTVAGAGRVRVLLTKSCGDETIYQTDVTESESGSRTISTVLASQSGSGEMPVVTKTVYGQYQGAVVVCEGADRASVRLELVNAVAGLTGLSADRITVIKMKS